MDSILIVFIINGYMIYCHRTSFRATRSSTSLIDATHRSRNAAAFRFIQYMHLFYRIDEWTDKSILFWICL